jgi:hypothetical protein
MSFGVLPTNDAEEDEACGAPVEELVCAGDKEEKSRNETSTATERRFLNIRKAPLDI